MSLVEHGPWDDEERRPAATSEWAVFGDLMTAVLGAMVLILVYVISVQWELDARLQAEQARAEAEAQQRQALEQALAAPLASGRVTLVNGRIGISGSVLFAFNSAQLQPEGRALLNSLAPPLSAYLSARHEWLMVSGFTDDRQVKGGNKRFDDNLELSAQRALTVTRALIEAGVPSSQVFAAAFGAEQPVASNESAAGRAQNRRVEIAPTPRATPERQPAGPAARATP